MGRDVVIIGGGPSGLAAAYEAAGQGASVSVFERLDIIGGLSRTIPFQGNRFDIGPHRFFTKNAEVRELFTACLVRKRSAWPGRPASSMTGNISIIR